MAERLDGWPAVADRRALEAELFGHWWFEGPDWINFLLRKMFYDQQTVKTITIPEYLDRFPKLQVSQPVMSSWGYKGYCEVWLEGSNDWDLPPPARGAERMVELAAAPRPAPASAARSTRRPASCSWPSRATGRSS